MAADHRTWPRRESERVKPARSGCSALGGGGYGWIPWFMSVFGFFSCSRSEPASSIQVLIGAAAGDQLSFVPAAAIGEWIGSPSAPRSLRIILSNRPLGCRDQRATEPRELRVTLTFEPAATRAVAVGTFAHALAPSSLGEPDESQVPLVIPFVRRGERGIELPPGGQVELTRVETEEGGTVEGLLRLEQPGGPNLPATSVVGQFRARVCPNFRP